MPSDNIAICYAGNEKSHSDASETNISESTRDLFMDSNPHLNDELKLPQMLFINALQIINEKLISRNHSIISELDETNRYNSYIHEGYNVNIVYKITDILSIKFGEYMYNFEYNNTNVYKVRYTLRNGFLQG